ncbi:unnamed protein product [Gongylonema pulchrum]|uniref:Protein-tyrosine-phosphatase n=1 Tax=Gongylonema pulchrum TaxID=637853 RepID=A0A183DZG0_9BILA|nr:unnamed protein product [Gongylonema pulchrum]
MAAFHTRPFDSVIVSPNIAFELMCNLPEKFQIKTPERIFRLSHEGNSS